VCVVLCVCVKEKESVRLWMCVCLCAYVHARVRKCVCVGVCVSVYIFCVCALCVCPSACACACAVCSENRMLCDKCSTYTKRLMILGEGQSPIRLFDLFGVHLASHWARAGARDSRSSDRCRLSEGQALGKNRLHLLVHAARVRQASRHRLQFQYSIISASSSSPQVSRVCCLLRPDLRVGKLVAHLVTIQTIHRSKRCSGQNTLLNTLPPLLTRCCFGTNLEL